MKGEYLGYFLAKQSVAGTRYDAGVKVNVSHCWKPRNKIVSPRDGYLL